MSIIGTGNYVLHGVEIDDREVELCFRMREIGLIEKRFKKPIVKVITGMESWTSEQFMFVFNLGIKAGSHPEVSDKFLQEHTDLTLLVRVMNGIAEAFQQMNQGKLRAVRGKDLAVEGADPLEPPEELELEG